MQQPFPRYGSFNKSSYPLMFHYYTLIPRFSCRSSFKVHKLKKIKCFIFCIHIFIDTSNIFLALIKSGGKYLTLPTHIPHVLLQFLAIKSLYLVQYPCFAKEGQLAYWGHLSRQAEKKHRYDASGSQSMNKIHLGITYFEKCNSAAFGIFEFSSRCKRRTKIQYEFPCYITFFRLFDSLSLERLYIFSFI